MTDSDPTAALDDARTDTTRRRYNRHARFYDIEQGPMNRFTGRLRRALWRRVPDGPVLEVGVGTGLNIQYYPSGSTVTAIDISEKMLERARQRAAQLNAPVNLVQMDAQQLDFQDSSFEAAVATYAFCSVPDPFAGLREIRRVLKPDGRLFLLEHVRSGNAAAGKVMDLLNPLAVRVSGANINRRTVANVKRVGFEILEVTSRFFGIVKLIEAKPLEQLNNPTSDQEPGVSETTAPEVNR